MPQLQRRVHRLVVLVLMLDHHAGGEQFVVRGAVEQVQDAAAHLVVKRSGRHGRQQRQRRAIGATVPEGVIQRVNVSRQHPRPGQVAAAQQP